VNSLSKKVESGEDFKRQIRENNAQLGNEKNHGSAFPAILPET